MTRLSMPRRIAALVTLALLAAACADGTTAASGPSAARAARLVVRATIVDAGARVDVATYYLRAPDDARVPLATARFPLVGTGAQELALDVDVAGCLADPQRSAAAGADAKVCPLAVDVVLRDAHGLAIDSTTIGPLAAQAGAQVAAPSVTLQAPTELAVVSGDRQLGWVGSPLLLPVVVKLTDRIGRPAAGRVVFVGADTTGPRATTDTAGLARLTSVPLGATPGPQTVSVHTGGAGTVAVAELTMTAVPVRRHTVVAGVSATCFIDAADGQTRCVGDNGSGQLGVSAVAGDTIAPVALSGAPTFASLAASFAGNDVANACALTAAGAAYCWGVNGSGLLGVSANDVCPGLGQRFAAGRPGLRCARAPQPIAGTLVFRSLTTDANDDAVAGGDVARVCGVTTTGDAVCWGRGVNGELGLGAGVTSTPTPTVVSGGVKFVQVSTGGFTTCGLSATGEAYCWGHNGDGSLGVGQGSTGSFVPVKVATTQRFVDIAVGVQFVCALTGGGDLYCWGMQPWNTGIAPGGAASAIAYTPTLLAGGRGYLALAPGGTLGGCALTTDGTAECWGRGGSTTLNGNGSLQTMRTPTPVAGALRFTELSMSETHVCGRVTDGTIYCWGDDAFGELGDRVRRTTPGYVPTRMVQSSRPTGVPFVVLPASAFGNPTATVGSTLLDVPAVRVVDSLGFPVRGVTVTGRIAGGGGAFVNGTATSATFTTTTDADGLAAPATGTLWRLGATPGTNVVTMSAAGLTTPARFTIEGVVAGRPVTLESTQIGGSLTASAQAGVQSTLTGFRLRDAQNNVVPGTTVAVAKAGGTGALAIPSGVVSDANGVVTILMRPDTVPATDTLRIDWGSGSALVSLRVFANPTIARLTFTSQPSTGTPGTPLVPSLRVQATDRYGNEGPFIGAVQGTVSIASGPAGAALGGTTRVPIAADGSLTFSNLTLSLPGPYQLRVSFPTSVSPLSSTSLTLVTATIAIR